MKKIDLLKDIINFTENLISSGKECFEVIHLREFEHEEEQHDDELIDSVIGEFTNILKALALELAEKYGKPKLVLEEENFEVIEEDEEVIENEQFYVPYSFASAVWKKEDFILYLAVCQEDREFPIILVIGIER